MTRPQVRAGRDHTLYAVVPGYVRFYKLKIQGHAKERRYIGIVQERADQLPRDTENTGRSRFCGLVNLAETPRPSITSS